MHNTHDSRLLEPNTIKTTTRIVLFRLSILILLSMGGIFALQILSGNTQDATILAPSIIPILFALWLTHRDRIELAGTVIAVSLIAVFTALATVGQGPYDIGAVVFPSILIIASLILKRRTVLYLMGLIILCNAWLTLGAVYGLYHPTYPQSSHIGQFVVTSLILLITMSAVYVLSNIIRSSLNTVQKELTEREKAEKALRDAEAMYRTLVENTSVIIYRDAPEEEGDTLYISPQIERVLGYSVEEWQNNPKIWMELTHSEDLPNVLSDIKNYLAKGEGSVIEYRMRSKDNRWVWLQDESVVVKGDDGKPQYIHGVLTDITARKNAEQKIQQHEAILNAVAETAQLLLKSSDWQSDANEMLRLLCEATEASHVYIFENHPGENGEILSSQKYEWGSANQQSDLENLDYQSTQIDPTLGIEDWHTNLKNGKPFYGSRKQYPQYWDDRFGATGLKTILDVPITVNGQWWGIIRFDDYVHEMPWSKTEADALVVAASNLGTAIERQQADRALRVSEEKFELAFHHTYVAMAINNTNDHRLLDINEAFTKVTGYTREDAIGKRAGRDLNIWLNQEDRDFIINSLEQQGYIDEYKAEFRRKNGEIGVGLLSAVNISIAGKPCQLYSFYDISRIDQLMSELKSKNEELQSFTYTVSHDLKAPLVTISGFMGYLEQDARKGDIERVSKDILRITEAVVKMQRLLNELLELSRIGRLMNPPEDVPFGEVVQEALRIVEGRLLARQVRVEVEADLPSVYGDRIRLVEVVQNLVDNAAKFMGEQTDPCICIGVKWRNGSPVFFVRDNGMGIEPQYFDTVFGLFNKLDAHSEGTGIGLSLVKRIVDVHGGSIWVESEGIGKGSTFYFTFAKYPGRAQNEK
ncbi:MAG: PAS domain S-box protein [Anaerolineales bacterium]|nr:PAS domain S-box protein [Anaerolineales bacterium]